MGYYLTRKAMDSFLERLREDHIVYAPKRFDGGGRFSDTDCVRHGEIQTSDEIETDEKSDFSFKEILTPVSETLFYFTENEVRESEGPQKAALVFLRSCDLHAVRRLDEMYLNNGRPDPYYARLRDKIRFALIGCDQSCENGFCVDMGTNRSDNYDNSIDPADDGFYIDCRNLEWDGLLGSLAEKELPVEPSFVTENEVRVQIPEDLDARVMNSSMWEEYEGRCINCGRCNFVCPTCSCFSMQDLFYTENGKAGERRRVWSSCMVDGFADVAGGGTYRRKNGERMRFKTLHKVLDFKQRAGYQMCVGCGRCDDICPEYISFSGCINKLGDAMQEVTHED